MPSPFPGMDPYLEARLLWPDVHHRLIAAIGDTLAPQVAPAYYVRIEQRTYLARLEQDELVGRPDAALIAAPSVAELGTGIRVAGATTGAAQTILLPRFEQVREGYLEIHDAGTHQVVTVIEVLSPTNKASGEGRAEYEGKRDQVLQSRTSLVEIDLLRGGEPMEMEPLPRSDYRVVVSPGWERPTGRLYSFGVRDPLPDLPVPLRQGEAEAALPLGKLLVGIYDRARYDLSVDYHAPPPGPALSSADLAWMSELFQAPGLQE